MSDLRIEMKFKNQRLYELIEAAGGSRKFAEAVGVGYNKVLDLLACSISSKTLTPNGNPFGFSAAGVIEWRPSAKRIAAAVGVELDVLFPEHLYPPPNTKRPKLLAFAVDSTRFFPLNEARALPASREYNPERIFERVETGAVVAAVLKTLTPREERVLRLRFGMDGHHPHDLQAVGDDLDLSPERARQIEAKALRKLRHPSHKRTLRGEVVGDVESSA